MKIQEGFITEKSGAYLGNYSRWVTDPATGERKRLQRAFRIGSTKLITKTKARQILRKRVSEELGVTSDSRVTFGWFVEHHWVPMNEGKWRGSTRAVNRELLRPVLERFGTVALEDVTTLAMQQWLNKLAEKYSTSMVIHARTFLRAIMTEAHDEEYTRKNVGRRLTMPTELRPVKGDYLTEEEIEALLSPQRWEKWEGKKGDGLSSFMNKKWMTSRDHALIALLLVSALRPSELFALKWQNFNEKDSTLTLKETIYRGVIRPYTKTTKEGEVDRITMYVPMAAQIALMQWFEHSPYKKPDNYIFTNSKGGRITKENYLKRTLKPLAKLSGITKTVNFQILRRTVCTHAQHLGSPTDIKEIMRHKKVQTSQDHYIKKIEQSVKDAQDRLADKLLG